MSGLHDKLLARTGRTGVCKMCGFLDTLSPADRAEWEAELRLPVTVINNRAFENELKELGIILSNTAVGAHRRKHVTAAR